MKRPFPEVLDTAPHGVSRVPSMTNTQEVQDLPVVSELALAVSFLERAAENPEVYPLGFMLSTVRQGLSDAAIAALNDPTIVAVSEYMDQYFVGADAAGQSTFKDEDFNYGYGECTCDTPTPSDPLEDLFASFSDPADDEGDITSFLRSLGIRIDDDTEEATNMRDIVQSISIPGQEYVGGGVFEEGSEEAELLEELAELLGLDDSKGLAILVVDL